MVSLQLQPPPDPEITHRKTTHRGFLVKPSTSFLSCRLDAWPQIAPRTVPIRTQGVAIPPQHSYHCSFPRPPWPRPIQLDFSELRSFTLVREQFRPWGIQFSDAIALQPSNPAFTNPKQPVGLMPLRERGPLTIHFDQPSQQVNIGLIGAKQIVVRVFHQVQHSLKDQNLPSPEAPAYHSIAEQHLGQPSYCSTRSCLPVRHQIQLQAPAITRIELVSEAPFLLNQLVCDSVDSGFPIHSEST